MARRRGELTDKQAAFVREYLIDLNAAGAARRAGYSERTADRIGHENLRKPEIAAKIQEATAARVQRTESEADRVMLELRRLALSNLTRVAKWGKNKVELFDSTTLSEDDAVCVESVSMTRGGPRIKLHSKPTAIDKLARHYGLLKDPTPLEILLAALPAELGAAIRRALGAIVSPGASASGGDPAHAPDPAR